MKKIAILLISISLMSFVWLTSVDFNIKGKAESKSYGYSIKDPIMVGGGTTAGHHFQFVEHLRGPNGENLIVKRIGSCGDYDKPDPELTKFDKGVLTCFSVYCDAFKKPKILYFDKYRNGNLFIPKYLTWQD